MKPNHTHTYSLFFLLLFLNSCYNDCNDFDCPGTPTFKFKFVTTEEVEVNDSLIQIIHNGDTTKPALLAENTFDYRVNTTPLDSLMINYHDTLVSKVVFKITKKPGTCCDIFSIQDVIINGESRCLNCGMSKVYDIQL